MIELTITKLGTQKWYTNNDRHNRYNPTQKWIDGDYRWYQNDLIHKEDGPATRINGTTKWYRHQKLHREDGPAIEDSEGRKEYWIDGVFYNSYLEYIVAVEQCNNIK